MQVDGYEKIYAIADEDLERANDVKTSAVHFMRFELEPDMITAAKAGAAISAGVEHENYQATLSPVSDELRQSLSTDLS
jgi:hypothetical protein